MKPLVLKLHPADNVAVALAPLADGTELDLEGQPILVREDVPTNHKLALLDFKAGDSVLKFGEPIGRTNAAVRCGDWVHTHNLASGLTDIVDYRYEPHAAPEPAVRSGLTFDGYPRSNGTVGTRNEIWIVPSVGCVNHIAEEIARICGEQFGDRLDGVYAFGHPHGCSQAGEDLEDTRRILAGLTQNPNAGGVLLVGLGCEENQIASLLDCAGDSDCQRLEHFNAQDVDDEIELGVETVRELANRVCQDRRTACPISDLVIGLECGGSDALSGVTANPLVGRVTDRITADGGSAILTEVPEMFGAEQTLMNRAFNEVVFSDIVRLINDYKRYLIDRRCPVYENPAPGNLEGGLTTLEEKSLGAIRKGGTSSVTGVLGYGERLQGRGLTLLNAPGNDAVSSTALVASGATLLLFTTGRGTPLGSPVPTIKISTNTDISERKPRWIDFNAGAIADGTASLEELEEELIALLLSVASGRAQASNERSNHRSIAIWKTGVTL